MEFKNNKGQKKNNYAMKTSHNPPGVEKKKGKIPNYVYIIVAGVALVVLVIAAVNLITTYAGYAEAAAGDKNISELARPSVAPTSIPLNASGTDLMPPGAKPASSLDNIKDALKINFDDLKKVNKDTVGWIYAHDTVIDYAIVQGKDNQKYVSQSVEGKASKSGAIFMDYRNKPDFTSKNTTIYGHNMKDGSRFHILEEYENQEFFDTHKLMFIVTPDKTYKLDIFSVFITNYNENYRDWNFKDDKAFLDFIKKYQERSMVTTNVKVDAKDRIVTLSTCDHQYSNDSRIALMAKLTEFDPETDEITP